MNQTQQQPQLELQFDVEPEGPPEAEVFDCGYCGKPITTLWAANGQGMLQGDDHCLIGDEVWHNACLEYCLEKYPLNGECGTDV